MIDMIDVFVVGPGRKKKQVHGYGVSSLCTLLYTGVLLREDHTTVESKLAVVTGFDVEMVRHMLRTAAIRSTVSTAFCKYRFFFLFSIRVRVLLPPCWLHSKARCCLTNCLDV